jgi:hypothetical protein
MEVDPSFTWQLLSGSTSTSRNDAAQTAVVKTYNSLLLSLVPAEYCGMNIQYYSSFNLEICVCALY